jgi:hypothetical protein
MKSVRIRDSEPLANGVAEQCVESTRREMLDHVIQLNEPRMGQNTRTRDDKKTWRLPVVSPFVSR